MKAAQHILIDKELNGHRHALEELGARIDGYSGGSPEGDIWQYSFYFESPLPPDRASANVSISWRYGWGKEPENELLVYRESSIYREGAFSSYEHRESYRESIVGTALNLANLVVEAMEKCKTELEEASNKSINFAPSALDALPRAGY